VKISAQLAAGLSIVFGAVCLYVAVNGFLSLGGITDPAQAADAKGFAWFWAFLAAIGLVFALISWWMARTQKEEGQEG
jgi:hypothetical protein